MIIRGAGPPRAGPRSVSAHEAHSLMKDIKQVHINHKQRLARDSDILSNTLRPLDSLVDKFEPGINIRPKVTWRSILRTT
jgi:hypothetical protein